MSVDIFVYLYGQLTVARQDIEDAIDECLGGRGEVTGAGLGARGANIDIEVFEAGELPAVTEAVRSALRELGVPEDTIIDSDGVRTRLDGQLEQPS